MKLNATSRINRMRIDLIEIILVLSISVNLVRLVTEPRVVANGLFNNADLSKTQGRPLPLAVSVTTANADRTLDELNSHGSSDTINLSLGAILRLVRPYERAPTRTKFIFALRHITSDPRRNFGLLVLQFISPIGIA